LLRDAEFVEFYRGGGGDWQVERITWNGHEFLDTVRDGEMDTSKNPWRLRA
jgi:hypothetical protein